MKKLFTLLFALVALTSVAGQTSTVLYENTDDAPMLSWSTLCNVTADQVNGIKAGDSFVVTVNAVKEGNDWPKFGFEKDGQSVYPSEFEMWNHDGETKTFPYEAIYTVAADDIEKLVNGFEIKGDGVQITKVVFVKSENGEEPGEEPGEEDPKEEPGDEPGESSNLVLWEGESTRLSYGAGPIVTPDKTKQIEAGDLIEFTITNITPFSPGAEPRIFCRKEADWEEIFRIELYEGYVNGDEYDDVEFPFTRQIKVTEDMLAALQDEGGISFGGEDTHISKIALVKNIGDTPDDDKTSKIELNSEATGVVSVYNLNGVCVRRNVEASSAIKGLPAGLYIIRGKKILVR